MQRCYSGCRIVCLLVAQKCFEVTRAIHGRTLGSTVSRAGGGGGGDRGGSSTSLLFEGRVHAVDVLGERLPGLTHAITDPAAKARSHDVLGLDVVFDDADIRRTTPAGFTDVGETHRGIFVLHVAHNRFV